MKEIQRITLTDDHGREWTRQEALEHLQAWRNDLDCCDWDEWEEDEDESI